MAISLEIFNKILDAMSDKPMGVYKLVYATKLHPRTIRRYLAMIELVQSSGKMKKEIIGARVYFRKERLVAPK